LIAPEQYGSRKHKSAISNAVTKVYTYDITQQYKLMSALCMNNLKQFYDCLVHFILSITLQSKGVTKLAVVCVFKTLQNLGNCIQTSYGNSTTTYSGTLRVFPLNGEVHGDASKGPLQGVGQGNKQAPMGWAVISTQMLEIMQEGFTTYFQVLISGKDIKYVGYSFVDDCDLLSAAVDPSDAIKNWPIICRKA
jgi:hypothetical protein